MIFNTLVRESIGKYRQRLSPRVKILIKEKPVESKTFGRQGSAVTDAFHVSARFEIAYAGITVSLAAQTQIIFIDSFLRNLRRRLRGRHVQKKDRSVRFARAVVGDKTFRTPVSSARFFSPRGVLLSQIKLNNDI